MIIKNKIELFDPEMDCISYHEQNREATNGVLNILNDTPMVQFPALLNIPFIKHGFSTRLGGVSKEHLSTMNLSFGRGDEEECVRENYRRICRALDIREEDLIFSDQVHDTKIHVVTEEDRARDCSLMKKLQGIDGLICNVPNLTLVTSYADCVPIYFVDPINRAIGLSHSGWRGTANQITKKTVEAMKEHYSSKPEDLIAVIGPSICKDCYEVSGDLYEAFSSNYSKDIMKEIFQSKANGKYQLDLWKANEWVLLEAGLKKENISISNICTCCNETLFFSHRATNGQRGNLAAFLAICN